jgi:hypothetical protein
MNYSSRYLDYHIFTYNCKDEYGIYRPVIKLEDLTLILKNMLDRLEKLETD